VKTVYDDFFDVLADAAQTCFNSDMERVEAEAYASSRFVHDPRVKRIVAAFARDETRSEIDSLTTPEAAVSTLACDGCGKPLDIPKPLCGDCAA
jgi:hypothetical protein